MRWPRHKAGGAHACKVRGNCAQGFHRRPRSHVGAVQPVVIKARQAAAYLRKFINRSALRARCQRQRKSLNDKRALLLHGYIYKRIGPGQQRVIERGRIRLIQPNGLRQAIPGQKLTVHCNNVEHRLRAKVDVQRGRVKIKVVGARAGVRRSHGQVALQKRGAAVYSVMPVCEAGQMDAGLRILLARHQPGNLHHAVVLLNAAVKLGAAVADGNIRLVPNDVAADAPFVMLQHPAHKVRPQVAVCGDRKVQAARRTGAFRSIGGPRRRAAQQQHHLAPGGKRRVHARIIIRRRHPLFRRIGLIFVPVDQQAVPAHAHCSRCRGLHPRLQRAKAHIWRWLRRGHASSQHCLRLAQQQRSQQHHKVSAPGSFHLQVRPENLTRVTGGALHCRPQVLQFGLSGINAKQR